MKELDQIIDEIINRTNVNHIAEILSGLAGAIHEMNLRNIRGHLQNWNLQIVFGVVKIATLNYI